MGHAVFLVWYYYTVSFSFTLHWNSVTCTDEKNDPNLILKSPCGTNWLQLLSNWPRLNVQIFCDATNSEQKQ